MSGQDIATSPREHKVFISHSKKAASLATTLADYLEEHGLQAWLSTRELPPGKSWEAAVSEAIEESEATVLMIDSETPSNSLRREWSWALESWWSHQDEKRLVPLLVGEADLPSFLLGVEAIRVQDPSAFEETQLTQLRNQLERPPDKPTPTDGDEELALLLVRLEKAIEVLSGEEEDTDLLRHNRGSLQAELDLLLESSSPDPSALVAAFRMLSLLDRELGEHADAKSHLEAAIAKQEEIEPRTPEMARMLSSLGRVLLNLGENTEAVDKLQLALEIHREAAETDSAALAITQQNLGIALLRSGDPQGARTSLEEALAISEELLGLAHPNVAAIVSGLGATLQKVGDSEAAKQLYERFLEAHAKTDREDPRAVADLSFGLGRALRKLGNAEQARDFLKRALEQNRELHGDDFRVAATAVEFARTCEDLGESVVAGEHFELALKIYRDIEQEKGPRNVYETQRELGSNLRRRGEPEVSEGFFYEALETATKLDDQSSRAEILYELGLSHRERGDAEGAEQCFEAALEIGLDVFGETHSRVQKYQRALTRHPTSNES